MIKVRKGPGSWVWPNYYKVCLMQTSLHDQQVVKAVKCGSVLPKCTDLCLFADMSVSNLAASPRNANSIMLSWTPPINPPHNYSVIVTRSDGHTEGAFVTMATSLTVPLSQQLCELYDIIVATMCVMNKNNISSGPRSYTSIALGMMEVELDMYLY